MSNITTAEIQMVLIGATMLLYGIQWIAVNLEEDKKLYNFIWTCCIMLQFITIGLIRIVDKSVI